ncbi:UNVERIFIED_CONTAM: hypothetical protein HDU68_006950 [Siphonaria sp. JEL0065]|nr:hypothetical protein HDU68_006950 [Siphonaria sp. JEL0065]
MNIGKKLGQFKQVFDSIGPHLPISLDSGSVRVGTAALANTLFLDNSGRVTTHDSKAIAFTKLIQFEIARFGRLQDHANLPISQHTIDTSEEFKQLEYVTEERREQYEKLEHQLHNFIKSMSKGDGKEKDRSPMDMFGSVMTSVGTTLETSAYSKALIQCGDSHVELANLQRAFVNSVKDGYGEEMSQQMMHVKEYQKLKTKLENRRLDYDAKLNKAQKAKTPTPSLEEDVRVAQTKYEETLQDITAGMIALNANEENQLSELCRFVDSEVEYFQAGLETLLKLQREFSG